MSAGTRTITIIQGHPDPGGGHFCHGLAAAYVEGAAAAGHTTEVIGIAQLAFPFARGRFDLEEGDVPASIRQAQSVIANADHLAIFYPVWNGGSPALVRAFFEQVFRTSFIFPDWRPDTRLGFRSAFTQRKRLGGKTARIIATMQMPAFVYRWYFRPHLEKNTLRVAGLKPVRETLIGLVESSTEAHRARWLQTMHALGRRGW